MFYNNFNKEDFLRMKEEFIPIKFALIDFLKNIGGTDVYSNEKDTEFLGLDLHFCDVKSFRYNLSLLYEDLPEKYTFTIAISKSIDTKKFRYFKNYTILKCVPINEIISKIDNISDAIMVASTWTTNEMKKVYFKGISNKKDNI
jgi:hypothetical protein